MDLTKTYQQLPKLTSGYHSLPVVTSGHQKFLFFKKQGANPIKRFLIKKLFTSGYHSLPVVAKMQKTKEKEPKRKIKIYLWVVGLKGLGLRV
jgi:hypothetical protein